MLSDKQLNMHLEFCNMDIHFTLDKGSQLLLIGCASWFLGGFIGFLGLMNGWLAFLTIWLIVGFLSMILAAQKVPTTGKAVLITGCDTGFGYSLALHLDALGFRVFAGCLFADSEGEGVKSLKEIGSKKLHVIQMDVTNEDQVKSAREKVENLLPREEMLWSIVNNAGVSAFGNVEWVPVSTYKKLAEVNVYGTINVTKSFLPLIRKSKGRVINVSSMLGRFCAPMRSAYVSSKYAVEGFSDCLRQEMKHLGVDVIVVEPGNYIAGTSIFTPENVGKQGEEMWKSMTEETKNLYDEDKFNQLIETMKIYVTVGDTNTEPVIFAFEEALTQKYPQARYQPMDLYYKTRIFVSTHLPEWIYDMIYVGALAK